MQIVESKSQSLAKIVNNREIVQMGDRHREDANWEVTYGISKVYLTDKEKVHLVNELLKGTQFVDINGSILTGKFLSISPSKEFLERVREKEKEDERLQAIEWRRNNPTVMSNIIPKELTDEERTDSIKKLREIKNAWHKGKTDA